MSAPSPIEQAVRVIMELRDQFAQAGLKPGPSAIAQALSDAGMLVAEGYVVVPKEPAKGMTVHLVRGQTYGDLAIRHWFNQGLPEGEHHLVLAPLPLPSAPLQSGGGDAR